jgi:hypothetical protein
MWGLRQQIKELEARERLYRNALWLIAEADANATTAKLRALAASALTGLDTTPRAVVSLPKS